MNERKKDPLVVIVGAGFGGLNAAQALANAPLKIKLIDRHNYHLFQPLLYQIATATLSSADIAYPIRAIFNKQKNLEFLLADVEKIHFDQHYLDSSIGQIKYDYLILAPGSQTNYFGNRTLQNNSFGLKDLPDANRIRDHILLKFENAARVENIEIRKAMLTFVICGGGPTGVEMAGAISELVRTVLKKDYPQLNSKEIRVILLEATELLVQNLHANLSRATFSALQRKNVEVRLGRRLSDFDGNVVKLDNDEVIAAQTLIWTAGVKANSLVNFDGMIKKAQGRVEVLPTLQLPQQENVYLIGDSAYFETESGVSLPMVAPVAIQQAKCVAANIQAVLRGDPQKPFEFYNPGMMATIGRNQAVAQIGKFHFRGWLAWLLWLFVHLIQLVGFPNRLVVLIKWAWEYILYDRIARLILNPTNHVEAKK